jgi:UDP-GlcNAc:undecaprenyl-phosphate GlcNAc-1-phosphate transferase
VPLTVFGMVALMNVVNFSDGIDGLAAGICAIAAITFVVIALQFKDPRVNAAVLAALTAGVCIGFLPHNFNPASIFMGDSGANLLGMLLAGAAVQGLLKTTAILALVLPLVLLAVPIFDTGMVVARRIRNRTAFYRPDREHFHHRLAALGFSQRRTVLYLYAWSGTLAIFALALVFVPARENNVIQPLWLAVLLLFALVALAATVYVANLLGVLHWGRFGQTPEDQKSDS